MRTASLVPEDVQLLWTDSVAAHPPTFNLTEPTPLAGVMLLDVEGDLDAPTVSRWSKLVNLAITDGATGITVDLRGCRTIDLGCLSVLVAASGKLKDRGDAGINLVTTPGSPLERRVGATAAQGLPAYDSAREALRSFRRRVIDGRNPPHAGASGASSLRRVPPASVARSLNRH